MADTPQPPRRAAALRYDRETDIAPRLVARGQGAMADRILAIARDHSVPTHEDRALVDVLSRLNLDEEIPVELWMVVAETLGFIQRAEMAARARRDARPG